MTRAVSLPYSYLHNKKESLSYRASKENADNSGDYNEYPDVYQKEIGGTVYITTQ